MYSFLSFFFFSCFLFCEWMTESIQILIIHSRNISHTHTKFQCVTLSKSETDLILGCWFLISSFLFCIDIFFKVYHMISLLHIIGGRLKRCMFVHIKYRFVPVMQKPWICFTQSLNLVIFNFDFLKCHLQMIQWQNLEVDIHLTFSNQNP